MRRVAVLLFFSVALSLVAATQEVGTLTFMNGNLRLIRGDAVMKAVEGMRLRLGDILESSEQGFDQLEFGDGTVVALGPSSQLFLLQIVSGRGGNVDKPTAELVFLKGWLKGETPAKSGTFRYVSPVLGAATLDGTVTMQTQLDATNLYVESGSAVIGEVSADAPWKKVGAGKSGQFFSRTAGGPVSTLARPTQAFITSVPPPFRDTLPPRISRFSGKAPQPVRQSDVTFSDVVPWLSGGRPWRMSLVSRFRHLASSSPAFRAALEAHLKEYPEWDPVLHPKKDTIATPATTESKPQNGSKHQ